ncbi:DUF3035 domain-containing protein [Roseobacter weihaiensis]|uniref:DUF3035 domain-containing protein n=1 Tax=Roseobacter weihaiensis TaxID=2763262 RepID=UPI001D0B729C|nr:DUF3035 domain-containing protein [Roseobacter sp. H9]
MRPVLALILIMIAVSACSNQGLRNLQPTSRGPDEFIVEPKAELTLPTDFATLPTPTPGQSNRTDSDPIAEMVTALGGRPGDASAPVPASDGALVTAASRFGVSPDIRQSLATEDAEFRSRQSRFTQFKLFPEDLYNDVYSSQALDARETAEAWRRAGARTPSFPPRQ